MGSCVNTTAASNVPGEPRFCFDFNRLLDRFDRSIELNLLTQSNRTPDQARQTNSHKLALMSDQPSSGASGHVGSGTRGGSSKDHMGGARIAAGMGDDTGVGGGTGSGSTGPGSGAGSGSSGGCVGAAWTDPIDPRCLFIDMLLLLFLKKNILFK